MTCATHLIQRMKAFASDCRGSMPVVAGVMVLGMAGAAGVSLDYGNAARVRSILQTAADSAALSAARELVFANADATVVAGVAKGYADAALKDKVTLNGLTITAAVVDNKKGVQVTITGDVPAMLANVIGVQSMPVKATAVARMNGQPICLIGLDPASSKTLALSTRATLTAVGCATYSDSKDASGLYLGPSSSMKAGLICSSGGVGGTKTNADPTPLTDCPVMADPLASRAPPAFGGCTYVDKMVILGVETLNPGVYCGGLTIMAQSRVKLQPGVYVFKDGPLTLRTGSTIEGTNVGFYFTGAQSIINIGIGTTVSLTAPKTGDMAGLLFFEDPAAPLDRTHTILSDNAHTLLGTIYMPRGELRIDANKPVAQNSAYTIIVVRRLRLDSGPNLVLNTNYFGTDIPFPQGVGVVGKNVTLAQ